MAADKTITINFVPKGDAKLIAAFQGLSKAQRKFNGATQRVTKSTGLLGDAFSVIRSKMLLFNFAMGLGVTQLVKFSQQAAKVESMKTAFNTLSGSVGNSAVALQDLKAATNGTMSEFELFRQANNAMILGITKNSGQMAEMFDLAQQLGRALGLDTGAAVESLITGIGRQSRLMLDNIGIIVKADEAYKSYAMRIGVAESNLTDAQKKQAFFNATMEAARQKVSGLPPEVNTADEAFQRFKTTLSDTATFIGNTLNPVLVKAANGVSNFVDSFRDADFEAAMESKNIDFIRKTFTLLSVELGKAQKMGESPFSRMIGNPEKIKMLQEQISKLKDRYSELLMVIDLPNVPSLAERLPLIIGQTDIEVQDKFQQESETLLNDFLTKQHEARLEFGALEESRLIAAAQDTIDNTIDNENALEQTILDIQSHFANERKKIRDKEQADKDAIAKREKDRKDKQREIEEKALQMQMKSAITAGMAYDNAGKAAEAAARKEIQAYLSTAIAGLIKDAIIKAGWFGVPLAAGAGAVIGSLAGSAIGQAGRHWKFEQGGLVGGRRHSQGGTMIEAEQGEFVMSRRAVNAIGVEAMNRINQGQGAGAVNISFAGNVMSQDFIEDEAIPMIKEAIRRGADIGVS